MLIIEPRFSALSKKAGGRQQAEPKQCLSTGVFIQ